MSAYPEVDTYGSIPQTDRTPAGRPRQHYSAAFKDLIARATVPGASVSAVAREHGINANQLFKCAASARKRGALAPKPAPTAAMVPVGLSLPAPGAAIDLVARTERSRSG